MQIQNVNFAQNNYSQKSSPNFTSIKSIKYEGLYKKYSELANNLEDTLRNNPKAMAFCNKYDVNIVFRAVSQFCGNVESSISVFFDNIAKSKRQKLFDKFLGINEDKVVLYALGNESTTAHSLKQSTADLTEYISPKHKYMDTYRGGFLNAYLDTADENIQKALKEKFMKAERK